MSGAEKAGEKPAEQELRWSRFGEDNPKLALWRENESTDIYVGEDSSQKATKGFERGGGFKGTGINATYVVKRLTAAFGPRGIGWDCEVEAEDWRNGAPIILDGNVVCSIVIHILRCRFWYVMPGGQKGSFQTFGQTTFIGKTKNGVTTDEEAPKKSLTDALTKAASHLGFGADIHMGMWDDHKYVSNRIQEAEEERRQELLSRPYGFLGADKDVHHSKTGADWKDAWLKRIKAWVDSKNIGVLKEAWLGNEEAVESTRRHDPDVVEAVEAVVKEVLETKQMPRAKAEQATEQAEKPPTPSTFLLTDPSNTEHKIGADPKTGRAAQERWLVAWTVAARDRLSNGAALLAWIAKNQPNLATMREHFPHIADEAERIARERCQQFRVAYPGDAKPAEQTAGGK